MNDSLNSWLNNVLYTVLGFFAVILFFTGLAGALRVDNEIKIISTVAAIPAYRNISNTCDLIRERYANTEGRYSKYGIKATIILLYAFLIVPYLLASTAGVVLLEVNPPGDISTSAGHTAVFLGATATTYAVSDIITDEVRKTLRWLFNLVDHLKESENQSSSHSPT